MLHWWASIKSSLSLSSAIHGRPLRPLRQPEVGQAALRDQRHRHWQNLQPVLELSRMPAPGLQKDPGRLRHRLQKEWGEATPLQLNRLRPHRQGQAVARQNARRQTLPFQDQNLENLAWSQLTSVLRRETQRRQRT